MPPTPLDLTGRVFGRLRVVGPAEDPGWWECVCLCKRTHRNRLTARGQQLRSRHKLSCGCLRKLSAANARSKRRQATEPEEYARGPRSNKFPLRLTGEEFLWLKERAAAAGMSVQGAVRDALRKAGLI